MDTMDIITKEYPVNYLFQMTGHLGHDNKLFDRTCPNCNGMHSSLEGLAICPKCSIPLILLTTKDGKAMAISEGTIYPSFGPNQKGKEADAVNNRKNGMEVVHRFKMFSFADEKGNISPPQNHHLMKSGAQIKIRVINHGVVHSYFEGGDKKLHVEVMIPIYPQYKDTVEYIKAPQAAVNTTAVTVDGQGTPVPVDVNNLTPSQKEIEVMKLRLKIMEAEQGIVSAPAETAQKVEVVANGAADPMAGVV